jgi:uncharacterized ParB-like nuclease family protein
MNRFLYAFLTAALLFAFTATPGCKKESAADEDDANEKQIDVAKVPAAALTAIKAEAGDAPIKRVLTGQKRGKPYYEAKYDKAGKRMMIQVAEDGKVYKTVEDDDPEPK